MKSSFEPFYVVILIHRKLVHEIKAFNNIYIRKNRMKNRTQIARRKKQCLEVKKKIKQKKKKIEEIETKGASVQYYFPRGLYKSVVHNHFSISTTSYSLYRLSFSTFSFFSPSFSPSHCNYSLLSFILHTQRHHNT